MNYILRIFFLLMCLTTACSLPSINTTPQATFVPGEDFSCWSAAAPFLTSAPPRLLVVTRDSDGVSLYLYDFHTKKYDLLASQVSGYDHRQPSPASPNGKYLWYSSLYDEKSDYTLYIYNLSSRSEQPIPQIGRPLMEGQSIIWSNDSSCLFFITMERQVIAYHLADGAMQSKTFPGLDLDISISPDGRLWATDCLTGICIHDMKTGEVDHYHFRGDLTSSFPRWSPDGKYLAFADAWEKSPPVWDRVRLVYFGDSGEPHISDMGNKRQPFGNLLWSPVEMKLLLDTGEIYRLDLQTPDADKFVLETDLRQEYYQYHLSPTSIDWAPDGKQLVIAEIGYGNLYLVNLTGGLEKLPLPDEGDIEQAYWIP